MMPTRRGAPNADDRRRRSRAGRWRRPHTEDRAASKRSRVRVCVGDLLVPDSPASTDEDILNLGGVYGDKDAGDPVEYDHLRLVLTGNVVEMKVFNRGITLLMTEDEKVKRIRRTLFKLDERKA